MRNTQKQIEQGKQIIEGNKQLELSAAEYMELLAQGRADLEQAITDIFYYGASAGARAVK